MSCQLESQLQRLACLFKRFQTENGLELEARIGHTVQQNFDPTTPDDAFAKFNKRLTASDALITSRCTESHVYYYSLQNVAMRSETFFDTCNISVSVATCCKTRLETIDIVDGAYTIRYSLSRETPVTPTAMTVVPDAMRIRQRTSHTISGRRMLIRYDLTRYWHGPSRTAVENMKAREDGKCAIELEVVKAWEAPGDCASSLHAKAVDVCRQLTQ